jgi:hypothetical protein
MTSCLSLSRRVQIALICGLACLVLDALAPAARAQTGGAATKPAAATPAGKTVGNVPYVGAYAVDHEFQFVTEECMEIIRSKKVLFSSRSWGLGIGTIMSAKDKKYSLPWEPYSGAQQVDGNHMLLKPDVFDKPKIVNYVMAPVAKRWSFFDDFLRKEPWKYGEKVDGAFQFLYCGGPKDCDQFVQEYFPTLDKLIADFPKVKFAIATHHVNGDGTTAAGKAVDANSAWNIAGEDYSQAVVKRYYGKLPILDLRDIVSTHADGTSCTFQVNGKTYHKMCPEYIIKGGDQIHPNSPEGRERLGKGYILLLAKMFCPEKLPPSNAPKPEILK